MKDETKKKKAIDGFSARINFLRLMRNETDEKHKLSVSEIFLRYKRPRAHDVDGALLSYGVEPSRNTLLSFLEEFDGIIEKSRSDSFGNSTQATHYYYAAPADELTEEELTVIICGINALQCVDDFAKSAMIGKLLADKNDYFRAACRDLYAAKSNGTEKIYTGVDFSVLRTIVTALKENRRVQFNYFKYTHDKQKVRSSGKDVFEVEPACLHIDSGYMYLIAYKAGIKEDSQRTYRVDRIANIRLTDEIEQSRRIDEKRFRKEVFQMYASGEERRIFLECSEDLANSMIDKFGDFKLLSHGDHKFVFQVSVKVSNAFYSWLAKFGDGIKILEPTEEASKYKEYLRRILALYEC